MSVAADLALGQKLRIKVNRYATNSNGRVVRETIGTYGYIADGDKTTVEDLKTAVVGHYFLSEVIYLLNIS